MAFYSHLIIDAVTEVATIGYLDYGLVARWNAKLRHGDELRATTGWYWQAKRDHQQQQGFKTYSAAARDAYYKLVQHQAVPEVGKQRVKLKVVQDKAA